MTFTKYWAQSLIYYRYDNRNVEMEKKGIVLASWERSWVSLGKGLGKFWAGSGQALGKFLKGILPKNFLLGLQYQVLQVWDKHPLVVLLTAYIK